MIPFIKKLNETTKIRSECKVNFMKTCGVAKSIWFFERMPSEEAWLKSINKIMVRAENAVFNISTVS